MGVGGGDEVDEAGSLGEGVGTVALASGVAEVLGDPVAQGDARYFLLGQEEVSGVLEHGDGFRCQALAVEAPQCPGLGAQPVAYVVAGRVGLHVRPGLLDDHGCAGGDVRAPVDTALVGVADRLAHREAAAEQHRLVPLPPVARRDGDRGGEGADGPGGRGVLSGALVLDGVAVGVLDEPHQQTVVREPPAADEGAVAVVHQAVHGVRLVRQDPGAGQPLGGPVQFEGDAGRFGVGARVDGDELAGASPGRGAGVERADLLQGPGELERRFLPQQHVQGSGEDRGGGGGRRGHVQLPSLVALRGGQGRDAAPHLVRVGGPTRAGTGGVQRLAEQLFEVDFGCVARHACPSQRRGPLVGICLR